MSLAWIPKGVLEKARRICFKFLWVGSQEKIETRTFGSSENARRMGIKKHLPILKSVGGKIQLDIDYIINFVDEGGYTQIYPPRIGGGMDQKTS